MIRMLIVGYMFAIRPERRLRTKRRRASLIDPNMVVVIHSSRSGSQRLRTLP
jgi:hypothetical protein